MPEHAPFNREILRLATAGALAAGWLHELRNPLAGLNAILRNVLLDLDNLDLPQENKRRLENQIGRAVDWSESAMRLVHQFGYLFSDRPPQEIMITELVEDVLSLLDAVARRNLCVLEVESSDVQQPVRIQRVGLEQVLLNILLFAMEHIASPDKPAKIVLTVQDAHTILITSDDPAFAQAALCALEYEPREELLGLGEIGLFVALAVVEDLGGSITLTEHGSKIAIAVQIATSGEQRG